MSDITESNIQRLLAFPICPEGLSAARAAGPALDEAIAAYDAGDLPGALRVARSIGLAEFAGWAVGRIGPVPPLHDIALRDADLCQANLPRADLRRADLLRANLRRADLRGADLRGADLRWADFRRADLRWADFRRADLRWAKVRWANLCGADLRGADLRGADLRGADLSETMTGSGAAVKVQERHSFFKR